MNRWSGSAGRESLENLLEKLIFNSRWILVTFYLGLVLTLGVIAIRFVHEFALFVQTFMQQNDAEFTTAILAIIDRTLMGNLIVLVMFSGYENFVSVIDAARNSVDRPRWMGGVDFAGLKLKLIGSVVALSGVNLLSSFMSIGKTDKTDLGWMMALHVVFVVTGVLFALSELIARKGEGPGH